MQQIQLRKFGTILISRPAGGEAFKAIRPNLIADQPLEIDFEGVVTVTPSWFDEFLTQLADYIKADIELLPTQNASVRIALPTLAKARVDRVAEIVQKALNNWQSQD